MDGYNIIFSWDELKKLAEDNLDLARSRLISIMSNYRGFRPCEVIIIFDAYRVKGDHREVSRQAAFPLYIPRKRKRRICTLKKHLTSWQRTAV